MNNKDTFDFINANFTMRSNANCYNKLNCFVDAMQRGQYYPITDDKYVAEWNIRKLKEKPC